MIDVTPFLITQLSGISGLGKRVYRAWPQKAIKGNYAIIQPVGRSVELCDFDGSEIRVRVTYSVDVFAASPSKLDALVSEITDLLASYNFHTTGFTNDFQSGTEQYRANISYSGSVDRRNHAYK